MNRAQNLIRIAEGKKVSYISIEDVNHNEVTAWITVNGIEAPDGNGSELLIKFDLDAEGDIVDIEAIRGSSQEDGADYKPTAQQLAKLDAVFDATFYKDFHAAIKKY